MTVHVPKYRHHKGSGQALVQIRGERIYLGKYGSADSQEKYRRLITEFLAGNEVPAPATAAAASDLTINELILAYFTHAQSYYVKDGHPTDEIAGIRAAMQRLRAMYGRAPANEFGPKDFKLVREALIHEGLSRKYIGDCMSRIRRMCRWAVAEEKLPAATYQGLQTVPGLRKGRTKARETAPVLPVDDETVEATLPHLPPVVTDMVRFQRLTGCRPAEVRILRPCDVMATGDVWVYRPESHKNEHHGRDRVIFIGPKAQNILRPYLLREEATYCFSPADSERRRRQEAHRQRKTPLNEGNQPGTNCRAGTNRMVGERYTKDTYRRAIERACDRGFPAPAPLAQKKDETKKQWQERLTPVQVAQLKSWQKAHRWSPNQLRHAAATEIRRLYGLEAAQVALGHASADVSQIYAERDMSKAEQIMREVG